MVIRDKFIGLGPLAQNQRSSIIGYSTIARGISILNINHERMLIHTISLDLRKGKGHSPILPVADIVLLPNTLSTPRPL